MRKEDALTLGVILFFISCWWALSLWGIRYETYDDMEFAFYHYSDLAREALTQGRFQFYIMAPFALFAHLVHSLSYLLFIRILSLLIIVLSLSGVLAFAFRDIRVVPVAFLTISLSWQNSLSSHNLLVSYPFYILVLNALFYLSLTLWALSLRNHSLKIGYYSAVLIFLSFLALGEFAIQYIPVLAVILVLYRNSLNNSTCRKIVLAGGGAVLIAILFTIVYRHLHPSQYSGNSNLVLIPKNIIRTYFELSSGLFPLRQVYRNRDHLFNNDLYVLASLLVALLGAGFLTFYRSQLVRIKLRNRSRLDKFLLLCFALSVVAAPNIFLSLTEKYQGWVLSGTSNYVYSAFSYLAFAAASTALLCLLAGKKIIYHVFTGIIGITIFFTQLNNLYVSSVQRRYAEKWDLIESSLRVLESTFGTKSLKGVSFSNNLFTGIPDPNYWFRYSTKILHIPLDNDLRSLGGFRFSYLKPENEDGILLIEKNDQILYLASRNCFGAGKQCYINSILPSSNSSQQGLEQVSVKTTLFPAPIKEGHCFLYKIEPPLEDTQFLGISRYNLLNNLAFDSRVDFKEGVYPIEELNGQFWHWVQCPAKLSFISNKESKCTLKMSFFTVDDMTLSISINNNSSKFQCKNAEQRSISLEFAAKPGENEIVIGSNIAAKRITNADSRIFSFRLLSLTFQN